MSKSLTQFRADIGFPQQDNNSSEKFALGGGLSIEEVAAIGDPAKLLFCKNYEPNYAGGYRSKIGCEPLDGHRQPSAFLYVLYPITRTNTANNPTVIGQQINQKTNGATAVGPYFLGWETIGTQDYIVLTNVVKSLVSTSYDNLAFTDQFPDVVNYPTGTSLYKGALFPGPVASFAVTSGPATYLKDLGKSRYYISLARKVARSYILPVGDSTFAGPSRAVFDWNGSIYAIRDKVDDTGACLFVTEGGTIPQSWEQLPLGVRVYFLALNSTDLKPGATVVDTNTGLISCVVYSVVIMGATVGGGDAFGYFCTDAVIGGPFPGGQGMMVNSITCMVTPAGGGPGLVQVDNKLPANGTYRMKRWNFTGIGGNVRMYGITTVGTAFELSNPSGYGNPTNIRFTPILTGQGLDQAHFNYDPVGYGTDTPNRIEVSHDHLWLAYPGGNLLHSGYQTPTNWVVGADQRTLGDDVTNLIGNINNTMIVTTQHRLRIMYGDVNENFQMRDLNTEAGAYPNTAQPIGGVCFLTDEGVNFYDQSANFGNYNGNSLSQAINSLLKAYMSTGFGAVEATIQRDHSFYRLYFDKGVCFTFCIVGKDLKGLGKCEYDLGSTLSIQSSGGTVNVGDTLKNWDGSESCKLVRGQPIAAGDPDSINTVVITDVQIDPDKWAKPNDLGGSYVYVNGTLLGIVIRAEVNTPRNFWSASSTIAPGNHDTPPPERIFFCCADGYVYEDDTGGAFGIVGNPVDFEAQTQFYYGTQAVNNEKCYRRMHIDVIGADAFSNLSLGAEYDDGPGYRNTEVMENVTDLLSTSGFDQNSVYGVGFYGGAGKNVLKKTLHGSGVGISIRFKGSSDIAFSHTAQAVQLSLALRTRRTWR